MPEYIISHEDVEDETKAESYRKMGWFVVDDKAYSLPTEVPAARLAAARWDDDEIVEYYVNHLIEKFVPKEREKPGVSYISPMSTARVFGHENILLRVFGKDSMSDPEVQTEGEKHRSREVAWNAPYYLGGRAHSQFQDVWGAKQEIKKKLLPRTYTSYVLTECLKIRSTGRKLY